jgi:hypothetical protein
MWNGTLSANYDTGGASTDCWDHSQERMPVGKWACVTWKFARAPNELQVAIDGRDAADAHVLGSGEGCIGHDLGDQWFAPIFEKVQIGWEIYQTDAAQTVYIDDVVLDESPIPCPTNP